MAKKRKKKNEIYEDIYEEQESSVLSDVLREITDDEEKLKRGEFYAKRYESRAAEIEELNEEWTKLQRLYKAEREKELENAPNSFISIITPIIEGQAAAVTNKPLTANVKGREYSDQKFAATGQALVDFLFDTIDIQGITRTLFRRYALYGNTVLYVCWDDEAQYGFGMPEFITPSITNVFVDGKIKDMKDLQKADWIIHEIGFKSIEWVAREYGEEHAQAMMRLNSSYPLDTELSEDDSDSVCLLHVWTRNNKYHNLQLIEMDKRGYIFRESDPEKPYYKFVDNKYPFFFAGEYELDGRFYHFGDGKLLKNVQETINKIYDEIVTTAKFASQPRTFVDPKAHMDVDEFDNDPSHPIICENPNQFVRVMNPPQLSNVLAFLARQLISEAQRITRYSDVMNGINPEGTVTATEIGVQHMQGNIGINDKRSDVARMISDATKYALGLMMEFWDTGKAIRITGDSDQYEWIDARELREVPVHVPADSKFREEWKKNNPGKESETPQFMLLVDKEGNIQTRMVDFDIKVNIGEGLPNSKVALFNIILALARIQLPEKATGQLKPLIYLEDVKSMIEELVGIPLGEALGQANEMQQITPSVPIAKVNNNIQPLNFNDNVEGFDMMGNPLTGGGIPLD
jgi:hypothetical protein